MQEVSISSTKLIVDTQSNRNQKLLLEAVKTGLSDLVNWMIMFCRFRRQLGASSALDDEASPPTKRCLDIR
jgi:hypothetical protein